MKTSVAALLVLAGFAAGASATTTWFVDITYSNPNGRIYGPGDFATVQVWAQFDADLYAFAGAAFSVDTDEDAFGSWSNFGCDLDGPGNSDGTANGGDVNGIIAGQLQDPFNGAFADTSNPIRVWHGDFTTSRWECRHYIMLKTITTRFDCYLDEDLDGDGFADGTTQPFLDTLIEGAGAVSVGGDGPCWADFDYDFELNLFDFLAFVNAFNAGDARADCDGNGDLDLFDFLCFVNRFNLCC